MNRPFLALFLFVIMFLVFYSFAMWHWIMQFQGAGAKFKWFLKPNYKGIHICSIGIDWYIYQPSYFNSFWTPAVKRIGFGGDEMYDIFELIKFKSESEAKARVDENRHKEDKNV